MRSQNDLAFHLRMATLLVISMFLEHLASTHLPSWSSPRIGVVTFVLGLAWVGLFAWQHGLALQERLRRLQQLHDDLAARTETLEIDHRARRSLPPL